MICFLINIITNFVDTFYSANFINYLYFVNIPIFILFVGIFIFEYQKSMRVFNDPLLNVQLL
jgi:hypothetical protein